jgi:hypothetical protein
VALLSFDNGGHQSSSTQHSSFSALKNHRVDKSMNEHLSFKKSNVHSFITLNLEGS